MSLKHHINSTLPKLNASLRALAKWFIHSSRYQPTSVNRQKTEYDDLTKVYPFCPPEVEQRAWLERQYQESPNPKP